MKTVTKTYFLPCKKLFFHCLAKTCQLCQKLTRKFNGTRTPISVITETAEVDIQIHQQM